MDFNKIRHVVFFGLLIIVSIAFLYLIRPFAYPLFWAAIIAGIFYPLHDWLTRWTKSPNISSTLTLITVVFVILIPLSIIGTLLDGQSIDLYNSLDNNRSAINTNIQNITEWVKNNQLTEKFNINDKILAERMSEITRTVVNFVFEGLKNWTQNSLAFLAQTVIMFYTLFFFLRDGKKMLKFLMRLCPLGDNNEAMLYEKFTSTAGATLKGTVIIGLLQGMLGALLFWATDIQGAIVWGLVMAAASILPPFGTGIVWLPAGVIMLITGNYIAGIIILASGILVIGTIDNFLRPVLVGKDTQMHPVLVLMSTLGGILLFGITGFIIGPIITSVFIAFWQIYEHLFKKELRCDM